MKIIKFFKFLGLVDEEISARPKLISAAEAKINSKKNLRESISQEYVDSVIRDINKRIKNSADDHITVDWEWYLDVDDHFSSSKQAKMSLLRTLVTEQLVDAGYHVRCFSKQSIFYWE